MKPLWKYGIFIGIFCALWTYIMGFLGWYKDQSLTNLFWLVVLIEVIFLVLGLKITRNEKTYFQQVGTGTLMAVIGSVIIFIASIILTTIIFPNYFKEINELNRQILLQSGKTAEETEILLNQMSAMQTPFFQALSGMLGTIFTGFVASLIISGVYKKKTQV